MLTLILVAHWIDCPETREGPCTHTNPPIHWVWLSVTECARTQAQEASGEQLLFPPFSTVYWDRTLINLGLTNWLDQLGSTLRSWASSVPASQSWDYRGCHHAPVLSVGDPNSGAHIAQKVSDPELQLQHKEIFILQMCSFHRNKEKTQSSHNREIR